MGQFVGLDVSIEDTSICVMDASGSVLHETKVKSTPAAISRALTAHRLSATAICPKGQHGSRSNQEADVTTGSSRRACGVCRTGPRARNPEVCTNAER